MSTFPAVLRVVSQKAMEAVYQTKLLTVQIKKCSLCAQVGQNPVFPGGR